jgi:uncharacterized cupin superfamily protein
VHWHSGDSRSRGAGTIVRMTNIFEPDWDVEVDRAPYRWRRSLVGRRTGSEQLGASLFEVAPGASTFPLHAHHANEELIVVLSGQLVLRSLEGERELGAGDVVACPSGRRGTHRLDNRDGEPARVLIVSTMNAPEINEFPDSGRLWARTYAPGAKRTDDSVEISGEQERFDPLGLP